MRGSWPAVDAAPLWGLWLRRGGLLGARFATAMRGRALQGVFAAFMVMLAVLLALRA